MNSLKVNFWVIFMFVSMGTCAQTQSERKYTESDKQVVREFMETVERSRDKFNKIQENAPLQQGPYTEAEAVVREAEQIKGLLDEGHYIEVSKLQEWIPKLNELVEDDAPRYREDVGGDSWNQSLQHSEDVIRRGEELIRTGRQRIKNARTSLDDMKKSGDINDDVYYKKEARIDGAEGRLNKLEQRLEQEKIKTQNWKKSTNRQDTSQRKDSGK